jgi:hypothetical protein
MWIFRYTYCMFQGHAFMDIVTDRQPYRYCLHCGKIADLSDYNQCAGNGGLHTKKQ